MISGKANHYYYLIYTFHKSEFSWNKLLTRGFSLVDEREKLDGDRMAERGEEAVGAAAVSPPKKKLHKIIIRLLLCICSGWQLGNPVACLRGQSWLNLRKSWLSNPPAFLTPTDISSACFNSEMREFLLALSHFCRCPHPAPFFS